MIKNIFFIHSFPFTKEAYIRDEFEFFTREGYNVRFLDVADFLKKKTFERHYSPLLNSYIEAFESKNEFGDFINSHKTDSIIITDIEFLSKSAWMYGMVFNAKLPYILFENPTLQRLNKGKIKVQIASSSLRWFKRLELSKVLRKPLDLYDFICASRVKYSPRVILTSKERLSSGKRALVFKDTKIAMTASPDYTTALSLPDDKSIEESYVLFIDQYFIHHPDFVSKYIVHSFSADQYYSQLNDFLLAYSEQNNVKVVVAAHPRRTKNKKSDFKSCFDIRYNETASLIKNAELVLTHFSTAISFAVIFNKPFELMTSPLFEGSNIKEEIDMIAKSFEMSCIDISQTESIKKLSDSVINDKIYKDYYTKYIKNSKADHLSLKDHIQKELLSLTQ